MYPVSGQSVHRSIFLVIAEKIDHVTYKASRSVSISITIKNVLVSTVQQRI